MTASRRGFLEIAAILWQRALAAAQRHLHDTGAAPPASAYSFAFFDDTERRTLRTLMGRIVPASERSGGAVAARVDEYIDFVLGHAPPELQRRWREGLARATAQVEDKSGVQVDRILADWARSEFSPQTPDEQFFVMLKGAVVEGFYTSEEGIRKELGYSGNSFLRDFPGCTHASHQAPAGHAAARPVPAARPAQSRSSVRADRLPALDYGEVPSEEMPPTRRDEIRSAARVPHDT